MRRQLKRGGGPRDNRGPDMQRGGDPVRREVAALHCLGEGRRGSATVAQHGARCPSGDGLEEWRPRVARLISAVAN